MIFFFFSEVREAGGGRCASKSVVNPPTTDASLPLLSLQLSMRLSSGVALGATIHVSRFENKFCRKWLSEGSDDLRELLACVVIGTRKDRFDRLELLLRQYCSEEGLLARDAR